MKHHACLVTAAAVAFAIGALAAQQPAAVPPTPPPATAQSQGGMPGHAMTQGMSPGSGEAAGAVVAARAMAEIKGDGISGTAEFVEYRVPGDDRLEPAGWKFGEVEVTVRVTGLKPGLHGMHLHAVGTCEPDFAAAGGHFDPGPAGNADADLNHPFHMGDLPNLTVDERGVGTLKARTTRVSLTDGPLSVFDADGTAVIIHANQDKGITGESKSGVGGGARIACGVLRKR